MLKKLPALAGAIALLSGVALAQSCCQPPSRNSMAHGAGVHGTPGAHAKISNTKTSARLVEVRVCPISQGTVNGKRAGSSIVGNYRVSFCCGGCKPAFDSLSKVEKQQKIAAALKKQRTSKQKA
jgi:hypothetical protein